ncbi:hypothetical protein [Vibrio sp. 10N.286.49.B3]|uniref:hypothetical protein n=1 Tax=Vibrio sp. 10N.286.49.B3 TaxID=1880855 RepID=UPI0012FFE94D|nr:hypothetical protein [Vibrio sp. 10N.286.49.B3]
MENFDRTAEDWEAIYKQSRLSVFPYLKDLNSGEVHYFNPKLKALQKEQFDAYTTIQ